MIVEELIGLLGFELEGTENLNRFNRGLRTARQGLASFARTAGIFAAAAGAAIGAGIGFLGKGAVQVGADFQDLAVTLETIEGSSEKARKSLDWITEFATKTPYDINQVAQAFTRLRAYGLEPQSGLLRSIGDASSAMGKTLMDGVEMMADAIVGENERLKEFGIRASVAGDQITYSWSQNGREMQKTVAKNADEIQAALVEIFDARFFGQMEKRSQTFRGILANIGDIWINFQRRIADAGFFKWFQAQFKGLLDTLQRFWKDGTLDRLATRISDTLIESGELIKETFSGLTVDTFAGVIEGAIRFFTALVQLGARVQEAISGIGRFVSSLLGLKSDFAGVMIALGGIGALVAPWAVAFAAMIVAVDDFVTFLNGGESVIGWTLDRIKAKFEEWRQSASAVIEKISAEWSALTEIFTAVGDPVGDFLGGLRDRLKEVDVDGLLGTLATDIRGRLDSIRDLFKGITDLGAAINQIFVGEATAGITTSIDDMAGALGRLAGSSIVAGLESIAGSMRIVNEALTSVGSSLTKLSEGDLLGAWRELGQGIYNIAGEIVKTVERMIQAFFPDFSFLRQWERVKAWFENFAVFIEGIGERIRAALSFEPPAWWQDLNAQYEQRQNAGEAGRSMGSMVPAAPQDTQPSPPPNQPPAPEHAPREESSIRGPREQPRGSDPDDGGMIATVLHNLSRAADWISSESSGQKVQNTVANDNRVTNTNIEINSPVSVDVQSNASPQQIGQAAGRGVRDAGNRVARDLAITGNAGAAAP